MKIAHVCLSNFFIDGLFYQENELVRQHVGDGHEVLVIASTETHSSEGLLAYIEPGKYLGLEGAFVHRLSYKKFLPHKLMAKLRMNVGTYEALENFSPDVILFHGTCGWELRNVARYIRKHPFVALYVDSHEDWNNSARGFISRELLHRRYYGLILRSVLPQVRKILCISTESIYFVEELYKVPRSHLEFFPLGGQILGDLEYIDRRTNTRKALSIADNEILLVQSGKQNRRKKLIESLHALAEYPEADLRLLVVGVLQRDIRSEVEALVAKDSRVSLLGWRSPDELTDLLCAADIYLQPGTQSVTMQHSLCCRCAIILDDVPAHKVYHCDNGWLINGTQTLPMVFSQLRDADLTTMGARSFVFAAEHLDYRKLAKRVFQ